MGKMGVGMTNAAAIKCVKIHKNIVNPQSIEIIILLSLWHNSKKRKMVGKMNNYK